MTILVTGGTGKTSSCLAPLLQKSSETQPSHLPLITSRSAGNVPSQYHGVTFNWSDKKTWDTPFTEAAKLSNPIMAIYLVAPPVTDPLPIVKEFIELASNTYQVKRFVFLSASPTEPGEPIVGKIHEYLINSGLDYCVLRPSWFMQNLVNSPRRAHIKNDSVLYSGTKTGRLPWISTNDIAAAAFRALTDSESHNTDHVLIGPELWSYDDIAKRLTELLGRPIIHKKLTPDEFQTYWTEIGLPPEYAQAMVAFDLAIEEGSEEEWTKKNILAIDEWKGQKNVHVLQGKHRFEDFQCVRTHDMKSALNQFEPTSAPPRS